MGLVSAMTTVVEDAATEVSGVGAETLSAFGVADVTGMLVAIALLYLLAYVNILEASAIHPDQRDQIFGIAIPLVFTFGGIIIYHSLVALDLVGPP